MNQKIKLIFVDRDGVVNEDVGPPGIICPSQLKLTKGAGRSVGRLKRAGYKVVIVTNQSCVGKGLIQSEELGYIHDRLETLMFHEDADAKIDQILFCTSLRNSGDPRMKPNPGMIVEACEKFKVSSSECVMIGDALRDLQAAASGGVPLRILVGTGYGLSIMQGIEAPLIGVKAIDNEFPEEFKNTKFDFSLGLTCKNERETILPFYYTRRFETAVDWILDNND